MWLVKGLIGVGLCTVGVTVAGEGTTLSWVVAGLGFIIILSAALDYSNGNP